MADGNTFYAKPLALQHEQIASIAVRRDIVYRTVDDSNLLMDIAGQFDVPTPAILFVHGGPLRPEWSEPKEWQINRDYGRMAACHGMVGVTVNRRFPSRELMSQSVDDLRAAIEFVRENSAEFNIDPNRICLWAFSGGGTAIAPIYAEQPDYLRCLISFYAVHLESMNAAAVDNRLPYYIARAGQDNPGLNSTIDQFVAHALSANAPIELLNNVDGQHGFDFYDPDFPPALLRQTETAIQRGFNFAQEHLL